MESTLRIVAGVIRKDVRSLLPLLLLTMAVLALDVAVDRIESLQRFALFMPYLMLLASCVFVYSTFQLDSPAGLTDDWLCRPLPRGALLAAKLILVLGVLYGTRAAATFAIDLALGYGVVEALQEALLLEHFFAPVMLPLILLTAIVTYTVIQGIGVLLALLVIVFVIPTPFVMAPGPLDTDIGEALTDNGLYWMVLAPSKLVLLGVLALGFVAVYRWRNVRLGRLLLAAGTFAAVGIFILPMWLLPWPATRALQAAALPDAASELAAAGAGAVTLNSDAVCFAAVALDALDNDTDYAAARQMLGLGALGSAQLEGMEAGGLGFITQMNAHGLPRDWRVKNLYVRAVYSAADTGATLALRPTRYLMEAASGPSAQTFLHQWIVPQAELDALAQADDPRLSLEYSLALLAPTTFELRADGQRRHFPGVGWCGATLDTRNNRIDVDCLGAGPRPALLSAELLDVPASRVDALPVDLAPAATQLFTSRRVMFAVPSPSLVREPVLTLTAWRAAGVLQANLERPGILGAARATCPLPARERAPAQFQSTWSDASPHAISYVAVDEGVQLEVLDWGGSGPPLVLLPGLGATAHAFDTLAPKLARTHRVVALTRRGTGGSGRPESGYDTPTLAQDALQVLDALGIGKAVFVGHSIAGEELSWLGAEHPARVAGLVYLDAAYDRSLDEPEPDGERAAELPPRPGPLPDELRSYARFGAWLARSGSVPLPEGELIASYNMGNRYLAGIPVFDMRLLQAIQAAVAPPRYPEIAVPALALYATLTSAEDLMQPWYDRGDAGLMQAVQARYERMAAIQRREIDRFRQGVAGAEIRELPGAAHWIFLSNETEVLDAIEGFVAEKARY